MCRRHSGNKPVKRENIQPHVLRVQSAGQNPAADVQIARAARRQKAFTQCAVQLVRAEPAAKRRDAQRAAVSKLFNRLLRSDKLRHIHFPFHLFV